MLAALAGAGEPRGPHQPWQERRAGSSWGLALAPLEPQGGLEQDGDLAQDPPRSALLPRVTVQPDMALVPAHRPGAQPAGRGRGNGPGTG